MTTQFEKMLAKFGREMDASAKRSEARFEQLCEKLLTRIMVLSPGTNTAPSSRRRKVAAAAPPVKRKVKAAVAKPAGKRARKVAAAAAPTKAPRAPRKASGGTSSGTVVERMIAAMGNEIMGAADVVEAMTKAGTAPQSKNLQNYLSFMLSQNPDHFENISRGKYRVKNQGAQGKAERVASAKTGSTESGGPVSTDEQLRDLGISPDGVAENPFGG